MQAFTLRRCKDPEKATPSLYVKHIGKLSERLGFKVEHLYFEQTNGLHCHGTFLNASPVQEKMLRTRGWNIKLKDVYDLNGWFKYITKDVAPDIQILEAGNKVYTLRELPSTPPDSPLTDVQTEKLEHEIIPTLKKKLF